MVVLSKAGESDARKNGLVVRRGTCRRPPGHAIAAQQSDYYTTLPDASNTDWWKLAERIRPTPEARHGPPQRPRQAPFPAVPEGRKIIARGQAKRLNNLSAEE